MTDAPIARTWFFKSGSNPDKVYETIQYTDSSTSCNCPGWTRRCKNGIRTCKHVRMVESGIADNYCETSTNQAPVRAATRKQVPQYEQIRKTGRKIQWKE